MGLKKRTLYKKSSFEFLAKMNTEERKALKKEIEHRHEQKHPPLTSNDGIIIDYYSDNMPLDEFIRKVDSGYYDKK